MILLALAFVALRLASHRPHLASLLAAPALLLCVYAGLTIPDIDQPLPLDHRSALTHGILPALGLAALRWARPAAAGLALGVAFHLAADVFPNAMTGYATVAVPFSGRFDATGSYAWLAANAAACAGLGAWLLHRTLPALRTRLAAALGTAAIGLPYLFRVDGGWPVLALLLVTTWLFVRSGRLPAALRRVTARP